MNIGLFTETYYPELNGVATSVLTLKEELEQMGHHVYVFTTTSPGSPDYEHNVFRVPSVPCLLITERRVGMFYEHKLATIIKKLNLDIIHTHTEFSLGTFGRIMARELKLPMVHTYHTIYEDYTHYLTHYQLLDNRAKSFVRTFSKVCCNTVEQVIVPTEKVRELLLTYHVKKDIAVVPTGIDLKKFSPDNIARDEINRMRTLYGIDPEDKVILYVGRVSREKNLEEVVAAMPEYLSRHGDAKLVVVGNGPDKDRLERLAAAMECREQIIFTGEQPWDTIGKYYSIGDVFVSASQSETQGLTYIEAMAAGLPVVAKEDQCLEQILENGKNGYTFIDKAGFLQGLDQVLYSGSRELMGEASRKTAQSYSTKAFAENVLKVYDKVLNCQRELLAAQ